MGVFVFISGMSIGLLYLCTGLVPEDGFSIGLVDGLTAAEPVPHTVIQVLPRRVGNRVALPECGEWVDDDGVLA